MWREQAENSMCRYCFEVQIKIIDKLKGELKPFFFKGHHVNFIPAHGEYEDTINIRSS